MKSEKESKRENLLFLKRKKNMVRKKREGSRTIYFEGKQQICVGSIG